MSAPLGERELEVLDAILARLIPTDENGPGAREARVVRYIERALAHDYAEHRPAYTAGLSAIEERAGEALGRAFADLQPEEQDAVLTEFEGGAFFELLRQHALEGMFGDPSWGGNAEGVGWSLLGYPGPRLVWSAEDQRLETI